MYERIVSPVQLKIKPNYGKILGQIMAKIGAQYENIKTYYGIIGQIMPKFKHLAKRSA